MSSMKIEKPSSFEWKEQDKGQEIKIKHFLLQVTALVRNWWRYLPAQYHRASVDTCTSIVTARVGVTLISTTCLHYDRMIIASLIYHGQYVSRFTPGIVIVNVNVGYLLWRCLWEYAQAQLRCTVSEVAADWYEDELMILQHIVHNAYSQSLLALGNNWPHCAAWRERRHATVPISHTRLLPCSPFDLFCQQRANQPTILGGMMGATENAGLENAGPSKMQGWKTRDH